MSFTSANAAELQSVLSLYGLPQGQSQEAGGVPICESLVKAIQHGGDHSRSMHANGEPGAEEPVGCARIDGVPGLEIQLGILPQQPGDSSVGDPVRALIAVDRRDPVDLAV